VSQTATSTLRDDYIAALLAGDAVRARHLVDRAVGDGLPVGDAYLRILQPAMEEVGALWEAGELSIAYEHYATSITQGILGALGPRMRVAPMSGRLAVLCCTPGERHALGVQMVADFLEGAGWEVLNLGPSLPVTDLVALVESEQPDVVGLSTATADRLAGAEAALAALREVEIPPFVVVGGPGWRFVSEEEHVQMGADARFDDPAALVELLTERFPPTTDE
jgi:methanogenic corrinoid protein MtbC1